MLHAAFIPFGELLDVQVPLDPASRACPARPLACAPHRRGAERNRGFGFVEFEDEDDAAHATENMNGARPIPAAPPAHATDLAAQSLNCTDESSKSTSRSR